MKKFPPFRRLTPMVAVALAIAAVALTVAACGGSTTASSSSAPAVPGSPSLTPVAMTSASSSAPERASRRRST